MVRSFAAIRQRAARAPVFITNHGKQSHVLCSIDQFETLTHHQGGDSAIPIDTAQLAAWIDQGVMLFDHAGRVQYTNAALLALLPHDPVRIGGQPVFEAIPALRGTLAENHVRRAIGWRGAALFEMPSPFHDRRWLQCRLAPLGEGFALLVRDITRDGREPRASDDAIAHMLDHNDAVALVHLSAGGAITRAHPNFAAMLGLAERRLRGADFADLVHARDRDDTRNALKTLTKHGDGATFTARLLASSGAEIPVRIGASRNGAGVALIMNRIFASSVESALPPTMPDEVYHESS